MKLGVLFSGGKDSYLALQHASEENEISCLLTIESKKEDSWMFHTPAIEWTNLQAESMNFPHMVKKTSGIQEKELIDLHALIKAAISKYSIEGIVTGALASVYQATRIHKICNDLKIWCFNPLWQLQQDVLLKEVLLNGIKSIITGVAAEPFDEAWLGRSIDKGCIDDLLSLKSKYKVNPAGEGGEIETFVFDAPLFRKPISILKSKIHYSNFSGRLEIEEAALA